MQKQNRDQRNNERSGDETKIYSTPDSTLQTPEEHRHNQSIHSTDDRIDVSNDDLHETKADQLAGSDKTGTAERKDNTIKEDGV